MTQSTEMLTIYTAGHSNRNLEEFIGLLQHYGLKQLVDLRTLLGSRRYPHFNQESLQQALPEAGIAYFHMLSLGGRRKARKDSINTAWHHPAFRGYADYMQTDEFRQAIEELIVLVRQAPTVIMCSETVPWRCHRSLVGDALLVRGVEVQDIISKTSLGPHKLTPWAQVEGVEITYPATEEQIPLFK